VIRRGVGGAWLPDSLRLVTPVGVTGGPSRPLFRLGGWLLRSPAAPPDDPVTTPESIRVAGSRSKHHPVPPAVGFTSAPRCRRCGNLNPSGAGEHS